MSGKRSSDKQATARRRRNVKLRRFRNLLAAHPAVPGWMLTDEYDEMKGIDILAAPL